MDVVQVGCMADAVRREGDAQEAAQLCSAALCSLSCSMLGTLTRLCSSLRSSP